jgi:hypothetical protein
MYGLQAHALVNYALQYSALQHDACVQPCVVNLKLNMRTRKVAVCKKSRGKWFFIYHEIKVDQVVDSEGLEHEHDVPKVRSLDLLRIQSAVNKNKKDGDGRRGREVCVQEVLIFFLPEFHIPARCYPRARAGTPKLCTAGSIFPVRSGLPAPPVAVPLPWTQA